MKWNMKSPRKKIIREQLQEQYPNMEKDDLETLTSAIYEAAIKYNKKLTALSKQIDKGSGPIDQILFKKYMLEEQKKKYDQIKATELSEQIDIALKELNDELLERYHDIKKLAQP